jgi:hypothetical protein
MLLASLRVGALVCWRGGVSWQWAVFGGWGLGLGLAGRGCSKSNWSGLAGIVSGSKCSQIERGGLAGGMTGSKLNIEQGVGEAFRAVEERGRRGAGCSRERGAFFGGSGDFVGWGGPRPRGAHLFARAEVVVGCRSPMSTRGMIKSGAALLSTRFTCQPPSVLWPRFGELAARIGLEGDWKQQALPSEGTLCFFNIFFLKTAEN